MTNVIACYKWVIDEADIRINTDLSVDMSKAKYKTSEYDRNAIEAAVQLSNVLGGKKIGLTFGDANTKQSLKDALSRGLDEVVFVNTEEANCNDSVITSKALASVIENIENVGLIICGEGSSDVYARQTASRIGAILDLPVITSVNKINIDGNKMTAVRKLENSLQTIEVELPAVVEVLSEINTPPIPGLKAVMTAGKKPVREIKSSDLVVDLSSKGKGLSIKGYEMNRKNIIIKDGTVEERVNELTTFLKKEGL